MSDDFDPVAALSTVLFFSLPPIAWIGIVSYLRWIFLPIMVGVVGFGLFQQYPGCLRLPDDPDRIPSKLVRAARAAPCILIPIILYVALAGFGPSFTVDHAVLRWVQSCGLPEAAVVICVMAVSGVTLDLFICRQHPTHQPLPTDDPL
eukprot:GGOE01000724.1.p1 GENE.GGOE01000724.1~~GGOE01000724.1.p1  ORF type:complete len:156 (-),score=39.31 GGOE01000724.1:310-753(-)